VWLVQWCKRIKSVELSQYLWRKQNRIRKVVSTMHDPMGDRSDLLGVLLAEQCLEDPKRSLQVVFMRFCMQGRLMPIPIDGPVNRRLPPGFETLDISAKNRWAHAVARGPPLDWVG